MTKCSGITQAGTACKGIPIEGSQWCYAHHPDRTNERRRHGSKGGKRGGRGRPVSELARLQRRFEELADKVLAGEVERGVGAVVGQLLNGARACARDALAAREQEELVARLTALEEDLETKTGNGGRRWRA
jgi:glutathione S-transferase